MKSKNTLTNIQKEFSTAYINLSEQRSTLKAEIETKEKELKDLHDQLNYVETKLYGWIEKLLQPVLTEIKKALPGWHYEDDQLSPHGLHRRVPIFFCKNINLKNDEKYSDENSIYIVFRPGDLMKGELLYETGETKTQYMEGTIAAHNGQNLITKKLESIEEAIEFLKNQMMP